jgi:hypothetical protein
VGNLDFNEDVPKWVATKSQRQFGFNGCPIRWERPTPSLLCEVIQEFDETLAVSISPHSANCRNFAATEFGREIIAFAPNERQLRIRANRLDCESSFHRSVPDDEE